MYAVIITGSQSANTTYMVPWTSKGELMWQQILPTIKKAQILFVKTEDNLGSTDILIFLPNLIQLRGGKDGKLIWNKERLGLCEDLCLDH